VAVKALSQRPEYGNPLDIYNLCFATSKELSNIILLGVQNLASQVPKVKAVWEEPRHQVYQEMVELTKKNKHIANCGRVFKTRDMA